MEKMVKVLSFLLLLMAFVTRSSAKPTTAKDNSVEYTISAGDRTEGRHLHKIVRRLAPFPQPNPQPKGGDIGGKENRSSGNGHVSLVIESRQKYTVGTVTIVFTAIGGVIAFVVLIVFIYWYWR